MIFFKANVVSYYFRSTTWPSLGVWDNFLALDPSENPVNIMDPRQGVADSVRGQWPFPTLG